MRDVKIRDEIAGLERELRALGSPERAAGAKRYLKSDLDFLGVPLPELQRVAKAWLGDHASLERADLVRLVRALWRRRLHELRGVAIIVLQERRALLAPEDLELLEWMLRRSNTWAYVDALAIYVVGALIERRPALAATLDRWAGDDDFWIRRSALLALLLPLRRGEGDWKRFARYADTMLDEKEFFIRKAIGWVLREVSKKRPELVVRFLTRQRVARVSGVTIREAVKYLPVDERDRLTTEYRER